MELIQVFDSTTFVYFQLNIKTIFGTDNGTNLQF